MIANSFVDILTIWQLNSLENRRRGGAHRALAELTANFPEFTLLALFPNQGLLINRSLL